MSEEKIEFVFVGGISDGVGMRDCDNQNKCFKYVKDVASYDTAEVFYAHLDPEISKSEELLKALYYLLWFPGYFGFNWNALYDCLRDLSWMPCKKIVLVHDQLPKIPYDDLKIYLEVLRDSVIDWGGMKNTFWRWFFRNLIRKK